jgi:hypothetical protein
VRRTSVYSLGVAAGALPALAFSRWAFGTPFHLPQEGWHHQGSEPLPGFLGITRPALDTALRILFYPGGIGPILLPALVGAVLLWRRGTRLQATLPLLVAGLFLAFNAASVEPFGGASPGPRFMIPVLPFLAVPLAVAFRAIPGATLGLVTGGAVFMVAATLTTPLEAWDGLVFHRLITGQYADSVASFIGLGGSGAGLPFLLALAVVAVAAIGATPWHVVPTRDAVAGMVAVVAWLLVSSSIKTLLQHGATGQAATLAAVAVAVALVTCTYRIDAWPWTSVQPTRSRQ